LVQLAYVGQVGPIRNHGSLEGSSPNLNKHHFNSRRLTICIIINNVKKQLPFNLFFDHLTLNSPLTKKQKWLSACLAIVESSVRKSDLWCLAGLTKGVGFIRFNLKCEAEAAIKLRSGTVPPGATEPITVKFANQPTISKVSTPAQPMATTATAAGANLKYVERLPHLSVTFHNFLKCL